MCIRNIWFYSLMIILSSYGTVLKGQVDTICFNDTILYEVAVSDNSDYNWNVSGGSIIYSSENKDSVIVVWNQREGLNSVEVMKESENYCPSKPELLEVFVYKPVINLGDDLNMCEGVSEKIVTDPGYVSYWWNNQPGTNEFIVREEGVVTLEVEDKYGCWSKDEVIVTKSSDLLPEADFYISASEATIYEEIFYYNRSENAVRFLWDFGDGESSELFEPTHKYSAAGIYDISLWVWSEKGCADSLLAYNAITVTQDCRLIFPNGFIPDKSGPSGGYYNPAQNEENNKIFHPLSRNIDVYELRIYNRWGELVFVSKDVTIGWDGYYKGKLAPQDTYLYTVRSRCTSGEEIQTTGSVTLIY